jgi:tetratricopeptide (TPR) repeat protein
MKELSRDASVLVDAGRQAFAPTEADRARLMAALTGAATLSIGVGAATGAQRLWNGILNLTGAARWAAVAVPVAAAGAMSLHALQTPPAREPARLSAIRPAAAIASAATPKSAVPAFELPSPDLASEPRAEAAPERSAAPPAETKRDNEIRQEVALLSRAQAALSRGRPQEALSALSEHAQRFPRGILTEERVATRARTLCALGRMQEAQAELKRMQKLNPGSAYLARARESCGLP